MKTALKVMLQEHFKLVPDALLLSSDTKIYKLIGIICFQSKSNSQNLFIGLQEQYFCRR